LPIVYDMQEVEMMIKVALLCTQATSEDCPLMSEVVRMLEGEGFGRKVGGMAACRGESEARIRHITKKI
jgi:hypothetical protein